MPQERPLTDLVCHVSETQDVLLGDIPALDWQPLATELGSPWWQLASAPLGDAARGVGVYRFCCERAGVEPRDLTSNELWGVFDAVADDRPVSYTDGLPDPKADDLTTGSLSSS